MKLNRRVLVALTATIVPLLLVVALFIGANNSTVQASSHREAPLISKDAFADNTDTYVWIPQGITDRIVFAASWIPFEGPEGGPNYWEWDPSVTYYINVDNDGDAVADVVYTLNATTTIPNTGTFLYNTGPMTGTDDPDWNMPQRVTVVETIDGTPTTLVDNELTAPANIGDKSTPNVAAIEADATFTANTADGPIQVYAGQTDDPFWVDLQVFDLLTLRGQPSPIGYGDMDSPVDSLSGFNVHSLIIEVPIDHVTNGSEPVLGVWATSSRAAAAVEPSAGGQAQVSRLGMPLVNEVVLPLGLKDTFNTLAPNQDLDVYGLLQESVEDPEVGNLLCALYGVPLPGDSDDDCDTEYTAGTPRTGRGDIFDIFVTGMVLANPFTITTAGGPVVLPAGTNVNQPAGVRPAEMIRVNTALSGGTCSPTPSRLGILGGDACGYPNGRRPTDDVVDISLLAVAGAAYEVLDDRDASFTFDPALIGVLDDGLDGNDRSFRSGFPYFASAQSGRRHFHTNEFDAPSALSIGGLTLEGNSTLWLYAVAGLLSAGAVVAYDRVRRRTLS
jgi:hypothetical protein